MADVIPDVHEARHTYIGGSDAGAVLGVSPYKTRLRLWQEKRQLVEPSDPTGDYAEIGNVLEPWLATKYVEQIGCADLQRSAAFRHPDYPFLVAHVDGLASLGGSRVRLVDFKSSQSESRWGDGADHVPEDVLAQLQHYHGILREIEGVDVDDVVHVYLSLCNRERRLYEIRLTTADVDDVMTEEIRFWQEHVVGGKEPEVQSLAEAIAKWSRSTGSVAIATDADILTLQELAGLREQQEAIEARVAALQLNMRRRMQDSGKLLDGPNGKVLLSLPERQVFDEDAFRAACPALAKQFSTKLDTAALKASQPGKYNEFRVVRSRDFRPNWRALS